MSEQAAGESAPSTPRLIVAPNKELARLEEVDDVRASGAVRVVWLLAILLALLFIWAWNFKVVELATAQGKVIASAREQQIGSLNGGVLEELYVEVGQIVEKGEILARLDPTQSQSRLGEAAAQYRSAVARRARLRAEMQGLDSIDFPPELQAYPELRQLQKRLFESRRESLQKKIAGLRESLYLVGEELDITSKLAKSGAASRVQLLRLKQQVADLELKITNARSAYKVSSREALTEANEAAESLSSVLSGRQQILQRTTLRAPVRSIVKQINVSTIGGVVQPGGTVMTLVPLGDQLLVEARVSPRDIAYIHPQQEAIVQITAYDYAIYGGLKGEVVTISPDTVRSEVRPEVVYYPVYIRTDSNALVNDAGKKFPIVPGMVTVANIRTGSKTVWNYLVKPFRKASEALHER